MGNADGMRFQRVGTTGNADFQSSPAQVVQHAHLFQKTPRVPKGQYPAQDADAQSSRSGCEGGGKDARSRGNPGTAEVVFTEEYSVKAKMLGFGPQFEAPRELFLKCVAAMG